MGPGPGITPGKIGTSCGCLRRADSKGPPKCPYPQVLLKCPLSAHTGKVMFHSSGSASSCCGHVLAACWARPPPPADDGGGAHQLSHQRSPGLKSSSSSSSLSWLCQSVGPRSCPASAIWWEGGGRRRANECAGGHAEAEGEDEPHHDRHIGDIGASRINTHLAGNTHSHAPRIRFSFRFP